MQYASFRTCLLPFLDYGELAAVTDRFLVEWDSAMVVVARLNTSSTEVPVLVCENRFGCKTGEVSTELASKLFRSP